jgi:hypothetical protein
VNPRSLSPSGPAAFRALALVCALAGCEQEPARPLAPKPVATLEVTFGQVTLERGDQRMAVLGADLFVKDAVETAAESEAKVGFDQGRHVELGENARLVISEDRTGLLVEVQRGFVLTGVPNDAAARGGVSLAILTPFGLTRLGEGGGEVAVRVGGEEAMVEVRLGTIEVVTREGKVAQASAGDRVHLSPGKIEILARTPAEALPTVILLQPVKLVLSSGAAEVQKKGSRGWRALSAATPVEAGDAVRARAARARLGLLGGHSRLDLERGAELVVEGAAANDGEEEARLGLRAGELGLQLARQKKGRVVLGEEVALESESGGYFSVRRTRDGLEVAAVAGDARIVRGSQSEALPAGSQARIGLRAGGKVSVREGAAGELALPTRLGVQVFHAGLEQATLTWRGEKSRDYLVQLASDARHEHPLLEGVVHGPEITVPVPRRGALHWRVLEADGTTVVDRGSATFAPEPAVKDLERLRNEVPDGKEKTTIYYQDKPPAVTFTFASQEAAASYRLAVYRKGALTAPVAERTSAELRIPLEAGALSEGSYVWLVTAVGRAGEELGGGGRMNQLELVYDNSVPSLFIRSPKNGDRVAARVRTQGVAPVGSRLFVNGKAAALDDKSRFDEEVAPAGSPPALIYRLVRPGAADVVYVRTLRRGGRP